MFDNLVFEVWNLVLGPVKERGRSRGVVWTDPYSAACDRGTNPLTQVVLSRGCRVGRVC